MTLSIIVPCRNERNTILDVIEELRAVDLGMPKEIIVVDGASTDGTREVIERVRGDDLTLIAEEVARGKGSAVRAGLARATGDFVVIQDADLELSPRVELPKLLALLLAGEAEVVFGSRFTQGRGPTPWVGYVGNAFFSLLTSVLFFQRVTDVLIANKMMRTEIARALPLTCRGFDLDAEITCRLLKAGYRILQVPVEYRPRGRDAGKKLSVSAGWGVLRAILRVRFERRPPIVAETAVRPAPSEREPGA